MTNLTLICFQIRDLQNQLTAERGNNASSSQSMKESRARIDALLTKVSELESNNLSLQQKLSDLAQEMEDQKSNHRAQLAAKDDEIKRLLDELAQQLKEYQQLQDIKVQLDMEIAVFRKLIESEEDRLGLGGELCAPKTEPRLFSRFSGNVVLKNVAFRKRRMIFFLLICFSPHK